MVAFTIEVDNEFEHRMPHRTALSRAARARPAGPWLASLAMWSTFLKFVPPAGITVADLRLAARTPKLQLDGMRRWGYITAETADGHRIDSPKMRSDTLLRPTTNGRAAALAWPEVVAEVEGRWSRRRISPG